MAAKQGLTAQLSQAGEDAKRAVLSRTVGTSHNWFSNLNTVCTIKSAPPKSPEVLELLSTKSGWLFKRNEQHVWQARWCCVVPHMFLYYFDAGAIPAEGGGGGGNDAMMMQTPTLAPDGSVMMPPPPPPGTSSSASSSTCWQSLPPPSSAQQDEWNAAIRRDGLFKQHEKRGFSLFHSSAPSASAAATTIPEEPSDGEGGVGDEIALPGGVVNASGAGAAEHAATAATTTTTTAAAPPSKYTSSSSVPQPAGIIDLECYTTVHRSRFSPNVLELAGDDQVNPDLRAFYFCATSPQESDDWTDALLNMRHSALLDEVDAYKQVCDGFAQQLQQLHNTVDTLQAQGEASQQQVYHLRSKREDERRRSWKYVHEILLECQQKQKECESNSSSGGGSISGGGGNNNNDGGAESNNNNSNNAGGEAQAAADASTHSQQQQQQSPPSYRTLQSMRDEFLNAIEKEQQNDKDAIPFACDHTVALHDLVLKLLSRQSSLEEQLAQMGRSDQARVKELEQQVQAIERAYREEKKEWTERIDGAKADYLQAQKELHDVQKELSHSKMQMTMYSSQQKNKTNLLNEHKRILKKEVIDLRSKLEDANSQVSTLQHLSDSSKLQLEQERQKNVLLERYINKIESQVTVQQNMMEAMSHYGGSVYGGGSLCGGAEGGPPVQVAVPNSASSRGNVGHGGIPTGMNVTTSKGGNNNNSNNASSDAHAGGGSHGVGNDNTKSTGPTALDTTLTPTSPGALVGDGAGGNQPGQGGPLSRHENSVQTIDDDEVAEVLVPMPGHGSSNRGSGGGGRNNNVSMIDAMDDNKSHMSELTEDRTQRHFEAAYLNFSSQQQHAMSTPQGGASPRIMPRLSKLKSHRGHGGGAGERYAGGNYRERPPTSVILGGGGGGAEGTPQSNSSANNAQAGGTSYDDRLQTIHGSTHSLPPGPITPRRFSQKQQEQQQQQGVSPGSGRDSRGHHQGDAVTVSMDHSPSYQQQQQQSKLTVAQRARIEADRSTTPVRVRVDDEKVQASLQNARSSSIRNLVGAGGGSLPSSPQAHSSNKSASGNSQGSGLWRRMEEVVLGPRPDDDDDEFSSDEVSGSSVHSTRVTDFTESSAGAAERNNDRFLQHARQRLHVQNQTQQARSISFRDRGRSNRPPTKQRSDNSNAASSTDSPSEEKKSELSPTLSLQERSQLLRAKQLKFLKEQGLIKDEQDVRGGAGASPGQNDASSVASTGVSLPRSTVSFPGAKPHLSPR